MTLCSLVDGYQLLIGTFTPDDEDTNPEDYISFDVVK
jgi:hypothetical protein